jgi:hypothetical protein
MVLPTSVELVEDIRKAPDDVLGTRELFREVSEERTNEKVHEVTDTRPLVAIMRQSPFSWTTPSTSSKKRTRTRPGSSVPD